MLQNSFFKKKDAINIAPFLDIMLVLFVIIIVVASFNNRDTTNLETQKKLKELITKVKKLEKENKELIAKNKALAQENYALNKRQKDIKKFMSNLTVKVILYEDYIKINNVKYSYKDFKNLVKNRIIQKLDIYYASDKKSLERIKEIKNFLKKMGWDLKATDKVNTTKITNKIKKKKDDFDFDDKDFNEFPKF